MQIESEEQFKKTVATLAAAQDVFAGKFAELA